ncbi:immunoglobulin-binding protein 1 [Tribolium castaneum]|uniref:Immunoglobulin-binding protein 1-like Protein n=1 Tax=Tribolium castaneum TaxID=7070 RepID=D6WKB8_TRICA|nr:PREDICTED: immunoglobulin-binding protein 1 [Tribolium castaneum]EFA03604.1 Immunoglobulin-binding protein 1-like Protein [Tribolium castaneum]|eukprot:XP_971024.1 PREDICTED: immunoglobulin-binding protein 1 [Tribolium castaneum]
MANSNEPDETNLPTLFNQGLDLYNSICNSNEPTNSPPVQSNVKKAMSLFEQATRLVSFAGIFSTNEGIEEVATNDLQYFLLPALLGSLSLKLTSGERKEIINVAEIYFKDFLSRCNDYGLSNYDFTEKKEQKKPQTELEEITVSVNTRANKIQRYKEQKELKSKLADLKTNMENEHADEEIKRDYFLTMLKSFIHEAVDELNSIEMEKPILEYMANVKKDEKKPEPKRPVTPLKPIIITKDEVQKAVFGAGYPSLPTMTVQEFYDKRVKDGIFPDPTKPPTGPMSLQQAALAGVELNCEEKEAEEKEKIVESDDPEYIERMRRMDEFKDEHRRGWGNRANRS